MSFARRSRLLGSTSVRLSLVFTALLIGTFATTALVSWVITREAGRHELEQRINVEIAALTLEFETEGLEPTVLAITARSHQPGALEYRLADTNGNPRVGNLPPSKGEGWRRKSLKTREGKERHEMLVRTVTLPDGSTLSIGDDIGREERMREVLLTTLGWIAIACLIVGLAIATRVTRRSLRRVDDLIGAVRDVQRGRLNARAPERHASIPDDLDELATAFNTMLEHLERVIASVRRVSTDVAHDLRTPLTHVKHALDRLRSSTLDEVARAGLLQNIESKVDDLLRTFDAMLRLAELESGRNTAHLANVDLAEIAERVVDAYRPDVEAGGRRIALAATSTLVLGDKDLLTQALANLIENAARHTPRGTSIHVSVGCEGAKPTFTVADDGVGIPEEERNAVLEPFYRREPHRSSKGSGLGLSIVAAVAALHRARFVIEDAAPGVRARFAFSSVT